MPSILDYQAYYDAANNRALSPITQGQRQELALAIQALNAQQRQDLVAREAAERAKGYQEQARLESSLQEEAFQRRTNDARSAVKVYQNDLAEIAQRIEAYGQVPISEQVEALKLNKKLADYLEEKGITSGGVPQRGGSLIPFIQTLIDNNEVPDAVSKEARNWFDSVKERTLANTDEGKREVAALQREYGNIGNRIDALIGAFPGAADAITLPEQAPKPSAGGLTDEALAEIAGGPPKKQKNEKDSDPWRFFKALLPTNEGVDASKSLLQDLTSGYSERRTAPNIFSLFPIPGQGTPTPQAMLAPSYSPSVTPASVTPTPQPQQTLPTNLIDLLNSQVMASPVPEAAVPVPAIQNPGLTNQQVIEALNSYR